MPPAERCGFALQARRIRFCLGCSIIGVLFSTLSFSLVPVMGATDITPNGPDRDALALVVLSNGGPAMWYGYAIESIYTVLGTVLVVIVVGILVYQ
jgi:hypothetical protein